MAKVTNVAVAVLVRADGQVLLGQRPEGKPWAGWWEFPGGKIESGESPIQGLQRELHEELGLTSITATPWLTRSFSYPEKTVKLHFFMVRAWSDQPQGREGQSLVWQNPAQLTVEPVLPANEPILKALRLPTTYAITNLAEMPETMLLQQLQHALDRGLRLIQVREKHLAAAELRAFARRVIMLARPYGAITLINGNPAWAGQAGANGIHLTSEQLMQTEERPEHEWVGASCHNAQELQRASDLGVDFVTLSPLLPTRSHPDTAHLGWQKFSVMAQGYPLPVLALGGMQASDLTVSWQYGAHGIAMQRGVW